MSEHRAALYVYDSGTVTITPNQPMDLYEMDHDDYSAKFLETLTDPITRSIGPGVYGVFYVEKHGIEGPDGSILVDGVEKKTPWPTPPPPPPSWWVGREDWNDHVTLFMVPLGGDLPADDAE